MEATYLDAILDAHRTRAAGDLRSLDRVVEGLANHSQRGFSTALAAPTNGVHVIAEIKRRSPSKGELNTELDPAGLAQRYEQGGATCLSVLTDSAYFGGSSEDLIAARASITLPVLRKDFTVSLLDVADAAEMGADCVLLIAAALDDVELVDMARFAGELGLDALVETHDEAEVERALEAGATLIGVNQRDLHNFEVDQQRAVRVAAAIPSGVIKVAESGVRDVADAAALHAAGYHALLIGETLVTADDPAATLNNLRNAGGAGR
jgi:indole-3-glycerol phosphate synthase